LESRRRKIINEIEEQWRLKIQAIWLSAGDENSFFSQLCKGKEEHQQYLGNELDRRGKRKII